MMRRLALAAVAATLAVPAFAGETMRAQLCPNITAGTAQPFNCVMYAVPKHIDEVSMSLPRELFVAANADVLGDDFDQTGMVPAMRDLLIAVEDEDLRAQIGA